MDQPCESVGAVSKGSLRMAPLSDVVTTPTVTRPSAIAAPKGENLRSAIFRKSSQSKKLVLCYDPSRASKAIPTSDMVSAISNAANAWNAGCNVNFEYAGLCQSIGYYDHIVGWDEELAVSKKALAVAEIGRGGVTLSADSDALSANLDQTTTHELGHIIGLVHSPDLKDIMYGGGTMQRKKAGLSPTPSEADFDKCNRAMQSRFGIPYEP